MFEILSLISASLGILVNLLIIYILYAVFIKKETFNQALADITQEVVLLKGKLIVMESSIKAKLPTKGSTK